ncbi:MAG: hypothetical protein EHM93_14090 [Bacteroidales bacterium]|nr:MAG: hypothetical protein EHM93_14090 [Bacteroidales bacterium]
MNSLEQFGPKLTQTGKDNPYRVPEGYFDALPSRVQELCTKQKIDEPSVSWGVTLRTQLALAAGICLFVMLAVTGYYYSKQVGSAGLFEKDYIKLVEESGIEFNEIQLYEVVTNKAKKDTTKNRPNDELMDYLFNDYIENGTLLEPTRTIKP